MTWHSMHGRGCIWEVEGIHPGTPNWDRHLVHCHFPFLPQPCRVAADVEASYQCHT